MKVLKFGGSSLGSADRIRKVAAIIAEEPACVVVCSAMGGMTNALEDISRAWAHAERNRVCKLTGDMHAVCERVCRELFQDAAMQSRVMEKIDMQFAAMLDQTTATYSTKGRNWMLARGEYLTSDLLACYMLSAGMEAAWFDILDVLQLDQNDEPCVDHIGSRLQALPLFQAGKRLISQGFICLDQHGSISTLGRGGSDYTATLIGAAIGASVIEIWTDVDGLRNNDPRYIEHTMPIRELSYAEAAELAFFGAKILHPGCVRPAADAGIPIHLRCTLAKEAPGTMVKELPCSKGLRAVAAKDDVCMLRIRSARMLNTYGFLHKVFEVFDVWKTPIDVITTSEVAVSLTIDDTRHLDQISAELSGLGELVIEHRRSIVCIVGDILAIHQDYAIRILDALKDIEVNMISFGGSRNNLTVVIPQHQKELALQLLHKNLFISSTQNHAACTVLKT